MGLIKTACVEKGVSLEVSLKHNFPANGNGRKVYSSQFSCPYAFQGGEVKCCHPYRLEDTPDHAWLVPIKAPKDFVTSSCPVFQNLADRYSSKLSLNSRQIAKIKPDGSYEIEEIQDDEAGQSVQNSRQ